MDIKFMFRVIILASYLLFTLSGCNDQEISTIYDNKEAWNAAVSNDNLLKNPAFEFVEKDPNLPDVLLIGNSISIGYTPYVREALAGIANVYRIPTNAGDTDKMLAMHKEWLAGKKWDVIHFNFGLHDLKYIKDGKLDLTGEQVNQVDKYTENLNEIVPILKKSLKRGGHLVFATTSIIPEGAEGRASGDEIIYNSRALKVMNSYKSITIDNQYQLTLDYPIEQREQNVHFHPEGMQRQGLQAAEIIKSLLDV